MEVLLSKEYIEDVMAKKHISKSQLADKLGILKQNVDKLLASQKKDINTVLKMAEIFGMSLQEFIGFEESPFKIKGFIKVGEEMKEIRKEEDWFQAEANSGVCAIPYYSSFEDACTTIKEFLNNALKDKADSSIMGRVNGEAVFNISAIAEYGTDDCTGETLYSKLIVASVMSKANGITTHTYSTIEHEGDFDFMIEEIQGEIKDIFYNRNE